ncbi:MAG TPA: DegT/DnrJ/EryC1/StrS family aminotransferase [Candidatus Binatia bacterium]|nr:DegT/DnrJ/EryC1/StrS family aminotransferase [Candidatus Binatia bacterium]
MSAGSPARIPLVDLAAQYAAIAPELEAAALGVLRSGHWVLGPAVESFERAVARYLGVPHAIGVASGSDALLLALMALDVGPGDEVITTPFSFFATVSSITRLGATPVFADIAPGDFLIDPAAVRAAVTPRTRAILPVHLYGLCADFAALDDVARSARVAIVEDSAQAIGAERDGRRAGAVGDLAAFSFYPTKNLGAAGDAGLVTALDDRVAARVRRLRVHGSEERYVHVEVGINSRMDGVQGAILEVKLRHLDRWSDARAERAATYSALLRDAGLDAIVALPQVPAAARHIFHQYVIRTPRRDELRAHLARTGIASEVYYPIPLHLQECFEFLGYRRGDLPESERAADEVLALPIYPELERSQQERVVGAIADFFAGR